MTNKQISDLCASHAKKMLFCIENYFSWPRGNFQEEKIKSHARFQNFFPNSQISIFLNSAYYSLASLIAQLVKNPPAMQETWFNSWAGQICWRRDRLPIPVFLGFPCGSAGKESACNAGDLGLIPGLGRSPGEGKGYPLQQSGLENSMDCIDHGVSNSRI